MWDDWRFEFVCFFLLGSIKTMMRNPDRLRRCGPGERVDEFHRGLPWPSPVLGYAAGRQLWWWRPRLRLCPPPRESVGCDDPDRRWAPWSCERCLMSWRDPAEGSRWTGARPPPEALVRPSKLWDWGSPFSERPESALAWLEWCEWNPYIWIIILLGSTSLTETRTVSLRLWVMKSWGGGVMETSGRRGSGERHQNLVLLWYV